MIKLSESRLSDKELSFIKKAFDKDEISIYGENIEGFEKDIENLIGNNSYVACTNSGTSAIHLALILCDVGYGDEVICQSFTFFASAVPILYQGAKPIFIDSEEDTWNMSPRYLEEAIKDRVSRGKKPKAIIVVHLYGMPAKMDELIGISREYDIPIIEDAAEAFGSKYKGEYCGTFGAYGIFSFNGNKIITTSGGGALVCKNIIQKEKATFYSSQSRDQLPHYQHSSIGYNYRMSNILAGIGRGQIQSLSKYIQARRANNEFYQKLFQSTGVEVFVEYNKDFSSNYWLTCILVNEERNGFTRNDLRVALEKENIESRILWNPMHLQPIFKDCSYYGSDIAEKLFSVGLCLPSSSILSNLDKERISKVIRRFL